MNLKGHFLTSLKSELSTPVLSGALIYRFLTCFYLEMTAPERSGQSGLLALTWVTFLVASPLGIIPWGLAGLSVPQWQPLVHGLILLGLFLCTLAVSSLKPLWRFSLIIVIIFFVGYGGGWDWGLVPFIRGSDFWTTWIATGPAGITDLTIHLLRLAPGIVVLLFLLASGRRREDFYLAKGEPSTFVEPSRILPAKKTDSWLKIALIFATVFVIVTLVILLGAYGLPMASFMENWILIPVAVIVAAMNGFNEEFTLRAAPLGELEPSLGKQSSLLTTAVYFGLGHYYGVPNGVIGVLLSAFLGWLLGKSMLETKGIFVAWLVHFLTDIPIFLFAIVVGVM
jgi:membrane protease YdiL (CAAX protease family)